MIEILERSSGNALGARLAGRVTKAEYRDTLVKEVHRRVEEHGRYRLVLVLGEDFAGFTDDVVLDDPGYGLKHHGYLLERLALVGGGTLLTLGAQLAGHFASEWIKCFDPDALEAAWTWATEHTTYEDAIVSLRALLGAKVVDHLNQPIGEVDDVIMDESTGSVRLLQVAFGGFLGLGEKLAPFPWRLFHTRGDGTLQLRLHDLGKAREQLGEAPHVERGHAWRSAQSFGFVTHPFFGGPRF